MVSSALIFIFWTTSAKFKYGIRIMRQGEAAGAGVGKARRCRQAQAGQLHWQATHTESVEDAGTGPEMATAAQIRYATTRDARRGTMHVPRPAGQIAPAEGRRCQGPVPGHRRGAEDSRGGGTAMKVLFDEQIVCGRYCMDKNGIAVERTARCWVGNGAMPAIAPSGAPPP